MFKFKLQSVLDYRLNIEEKIQNEFSDLKRALEDEKQILKSLTADRESLMGELRDIQRKIIRPDDISNLVAYIEKLREKEKEQRNVILTAEEKLESKRQELMEAVKNRKVIENLREKHEAEYHKEMNELERKNSDEMSVLKFSRRDT